MSEQSQIFQDVFRLVYDSDVPDDYVLATVNNLSNRGIENPTPEQVMAAYTEALRNPTCPACGFPRYSATCRKRCP